MSARYLVAVFGLMLGASPLAAQTVAITHARISTMGPAGEVAGTVLVRDGRIVAVGDPKVPADARVIDAAGGIVTPGFVLADARLGVMDVAQVPLSVDRFQHNPAISASFDMSDALYPDSVLIPVARLGGITRAVVTPLYEDAAGRMLQFAGQAAVVDLGQRAEMLTKPRVAMMIELGEGGAERAGGARGAALAELRATLADVRAFIRNRAAYERGATRDFALSRGALEAVVPVIVDPRQDLPQDFAKLGARLDNAARLHAAGVTVVLKDGEGGNYRARELRNGAGQAVAHGLPHAAALAAITINPARVFGIADRVGSIEPGKEADLVLWSGDPGGPRARPRASRGR